MAALRTDAARTVALRRVALAALLLLVGAGTLISAGKSSVNDGSVVRALLLADAFRGGRVPAHADGDVQSPGYVLVLAALAVTSPSTRTALVCWRDKREGCRVSSLPLLLVAQWLAAALSVVLAFRIAHRLSGTTAVAIIAALMFYLSTRPGEFAGAVRGHVWYVLALMAFVNLLVGAVAQRSWLRAAGAGAALGLAMQFELAAVVALPVTVVLLLLIRTNADVRGTAARSWPLSRAFLLGACATAMGLLWLATANGYDPHAYVRRAALQLAQHAAFLGLERASWTAAVATQVPWIGDFIASVLPASEVRRIAIGAGPGSLLAHGVAVLYPEAMTRAGGSSIAALALLWNEHVMGKPLAYLASLPPVLMRGLFAGGGLIALIGLFHVPRMLSYARAGERLALHIIAFAPVLAMLVVNVFLTSNEFWLNPLLPFVYAYAIAYVAQGW